MFILWWWCLFGEDDRGSEEEDGGGAEVTMVFASMLEKFLIKCEGIVFASMLSS